MRIRGGFFAQRARKVKRPLHLEVVMAQPSLLHRVVAFCRGREFSNIDPIAEAFPDTARHALETTVIAAIRHGRLRGKIVETPLMDGPIHAISYMRG